MIIWHGLDDVHAELDASVVSIGVFDGVHRGHQRLINTAVSLAREKKLPSVLVTFDPHPKEIFTPGNNPPLLTTAAQRQLMCAELGIDAVLVIDFNRELAGLSPEDYFRTLLIDTLGAQHVVVGENFTFGDMGRGTSQTMVELGEKYDVGVSVVELLHDEDERICSTNIREHLDAGEVGRAAWALGRAYSLTGEVVHGSGRGGAELGYPTANQYFPDTVAVPGDGVYAGWFVIEGDDYIDGDMEPGLAYPAAISVGTNPTFGDDRRSVESFIMDRHADLYGHIATVYFVEKIRDMVKFHSVEELLENMARDVQRTREILIDAPRPTPLGR
ncbi:bifunctional riboflavin kinase/FAD synthetase [Corynebacterium yudongzhengii]|uniref:Riboflavin biosynthesis protein n=1 Tax=Corynebacterium yudongzhengii TaxID=2080740 RepID=A0A2U1T5J1_9CORY|nr:bifunctional riboflavin kinase/FAD synthetase [Corynebacterium yudongzhengii]AWB81725.1 bifunctional riboflavin kinase/FAD synthetase [Corynebacterium yudongzhengii]PWC01158.1 bifunctional riboflavin kinase/FAD synthetase [Corynebacterium yudongzhengii]